MSLRQPYTLWSLIIGSVVMSAFAQIILKKGMSLITSQADSANDGSLNLAIYALTSPAVILGLMLYGAGAILWLAVLARLDVTQAYPFVGLGFIITMIFGYFFLGESIGLQRAIGTTLVAVGVVIVAQS